MRYFNVSVAALFLLSSCGHKKEVKAVTSVPVVDVIIAKQQTVSNLIEVNGTIIANQSVELRPEVAGRIVFLNVHEGSKVEKGAVIARINSEDLQAQLAKSNVQLELATTTERRLKKLLDINGVNQSDYDAALNQVNSLKADIKYYSVLIDKTILKAPFTGTLGLRNVSLGAIVSTTDVLASLQQLDSLKIDFTLPDAYSSVIHRGDTVTFSTNAVKQQKEKAVIVASEPQVNTTTRNLRVRANILQSNGSIGSFAKVQIDGGENTNTIMVPTSAIIPDDKSNKVVVIRGSKAIYTDVKTGIRQASNIEIVSGLKPGDSIAVTGILFTRNNGAVKVRNVRSIEEQAK